MGRTKLYTDEELRQRTNERRKIYQRRRYANDEEFRNKRKEHSLNRYNDNKTRLQEKMDKLEELEKKLKEATA